MSPQNPEQDGGKKEEERKGGAVPLWSDPGAKKAPASFWSSVNPPKTPSPKSMPVPGLRAFPGAKDKPTDSFFSSVASKGKPAAGIPLLKGIHGGTLVNRIKGLKSKDIVFIAAGLSVLLLAPIAEHMISSPEDQGGTLQQGFSAPGNGLFGGDNPYEPGMANIAPGNLPGQGTEVVTPLNVRDPASLIMSPGGEEKKPVPQIEPPKTTAQPDRGWNDALASAAKKGVSKAAAKAHLPMPNSKLAKISGLGSPSGGTHASLNLAAPTGAGLFSSPNSQDHMARVSAIPGYNGAGRRSNAGGTGGAISGFGGRTGGGGSGGSASESMPGGISGGGSGMSGGLPWSADPSKNPGNNGASGNISINITQKEDLAWLRRKMEMEKAVDLKWAKKKYDQLERKKMLEQLAAQTAQQAFLKILDKLLEGAKGGGDDAGGGAGGDDSAKPDPTGPETETNPGDQPRPVSQAYRIDPGGSRLGIPIDAESSDNAGTHMARLGRDAKEGDVSAQYPDWPSDADDSAGAEMKKVVKQEPYNIEEIDTSLREAGKTKPPTVRPVADVRGALLAGGVRLGVGAKSFEEQTLPKATAANAALDKAIAANNDYAKAVKEQVAPLNTEARKLEALDKKLQQAKPELVKADTQRPTFVSKMLDAKNTWEHTGDKQKEVDKAKAAIAAYKPLGIAAEAKVKGLKAEGARNAAAVTSAVAKADERLTKALAKATAALNVYQQKMRDYEQFVVSVKMPGNDTNMAKLQTNAASLARVYRVKGGKLSEQLHSVGYGHTYISVAGSGLKKAYGQGGER